jgi:hypothetical protein
MRLEETGAENETKVWLTDPEIEELPIDSERFFDSTMLS